MKNKHVTRKPNVKGEFTTIHHSILNDKRITPIAFRVLVSILSDADHFNLTHQLLLNRLGIAENTLRKALKNLEQCGYLRTKPQKYKGNFYTISEFGNLKPELTETIEAPAQAELQPEVIQNTPVEEKEPNPEEKLFEQYISSIGQFTSSDTKIFDEIMKLINLHGSDFHAFKSDADKVITKRKKERYSHYKTLIELKPANITPKAIKAYTDWLKNEIFNKNNINLNADSMWIQIKSRNFKPKVDFETEYADKMEEMRADGDY